MHIALLAFGLLMADIAFGICTKPVLIEAPLSYRKDEVARSPYAPMDIVVVTSFLRKLGCQVVQQSKAKPLRKIGKIDLALYEANAQAGIPAGYSGVWLRNKVYGLVATSMPSMSGIAANPLLALPRLKLAIDPASRFGSALRRLYRHAGKTGQVLFNQSLERRLRLLHEGRVDIVFDDLVNAHRIHFAMGNQKTLIPLPFFQSIEPVYLIAPMPTSGDVTAILEELASRKTEIRSAYRQYLGTFVAKDSKSSAWMNRVLLPAQ